jgi:hypothetical protein
VLVLFGRFFSQTHLVTLMLTLQICNDVFWTTLSPIFGVEMDLELTLSDHLGQAICFNSTRAKSRRMAKRKKRNAGVDFSCSFVAENSAEKFLLQNASENGNFPRKKMFFPEKF